MRLRRMQLKLLVTACALVALIAVVGRSLAQMRQIDQSDRDERRLERKIETLQKDYDALNLSIEKRLTTIETKADVAVWMIGFTLLLLGGHLIAILTRGVRDWVIEVRAAAAKKKDDGP